MAAKNFTSLLTKMAKTWGPHRLAKTIQCIRSVFKFAYDAGLIPVPLRYGPGFEGPNKKTMRLEWAESGPCMFEAGELRRAGRRIFVTGQGIDISGRSRFRRRTS